MIHHHNRVTSQTLRDHHTHKLAFRNIWSGGARFSSGYMHSPRWYATAYFKVPSRWQRSNAPQSWS
eukprot:scaffold626_cov337-Pavlova_lutheri.AAC.54